MPAGLDEDTARTLQSGRETLGTVLRSAQKHLQKVFVVWVVGLLATIMVLQNGGWDTLRRDLLNRNLGPELLQKVDLVAVTPFDVILLQVKIGIVVGIVISLPLLIYFSRDGLRRRGYWPEDTVPRWKLAAIGLVSLLLFSGGVAYAYELFFPIMFAFLAGNADSAGFLPKYSIVMFVEFVALLGTSFGMAAQLPLLMSTLSYTGIVPYETFREKWKWAVVIIFGLGAAFSPPDPFTQVMWATPLVGLYVVSLGISKLLVQAKRAGEEIGARSVARDRWNKLAAGALVAGAITNFVILSDLAFGYVKSVVAFVSTSRTRADVVRPEFFGLSAEASAAILGAVVGLIAAVGMLYYYMIRELDVAAAEAGHFGDPSKIDVGSLTADAVRAAPPEAFEEMEEAEALKLADDAMSDDEPEKAEAILERWDRATEDAEDGEAAGGATADEEEEGSVFTSTTAGMVDAFTEDETTEDDIGGLYYDLAFIADSLTSKAVWFVAVFMVVAGLTFVFLYSGVPGIGAAAANTPGDTTVVAENASEVVERATLVSRNATVYHENNTVAVERAVVVARNGTAPIEPGIVAIPDNSTFYRNASVFRTDAATGANASVATNATVLVTPEPPTGSTSGIGIIKNAFVANLPPSMQEQVSFVTLHPVEHLIFIVKFSTILGAVATLPLLLYFAWPAMRERGLARGSRNVLGVWGGTVLGTLVLGTVVGFLFIAPAVLSWLARDVIDSGMLIRYRVANFGWIVLFFTVGIGLLVEIPVSMLLFHKGDILPFGRILDHWRTVTLGVFVVSALLSPKSWFTMFMVAVPITLAFLLGLGLLWLITLGGRRTRDSAGKPAD